MKPLRLFCLLTLALLIRNAHVRAQVGEHRNDLTVGVTGGYLLNRTSFNPTIKKVYKGGETFGVTVRYTCEKYFSAICAIQAEVNYANMGWKEDIDPEYSTDTYYRDMRYIQVPIFARLSWGRERKGFLFGFMIGPQLGYCFSETEHYSDPWAGKPRPNNVTAQYGKAVERRFEYGLTGGLSFEIGTRHAGRFLLEGRYFYGLSDIFNNSKKDPFGRSANGAIIIKAGYLFDIIRTKGITEKPRKSKKNKSAVLSE
ncbi:MAG: PorT family protein [Bacteroidaceae bacterium]|nr:PorT family protein [Bacteroidaceae bacterium]MBR1755086.1 PorT family protein [Bacteroidaceae bacterium]